MPYNNEAYTKKISIKTILLLTVIQATAQSNLVPNGSFEKYNNCPVNISAVAQANMPQEFVTDWITPTYGTTDYFNACSGYSASVPLNFSGYQPAADGKGYCGIFAFATDDTTTNDYIYREYLSVRLRKPLKQGKTYCVGFYASPSETIKFNYAPYMFGTNEPGLYLSKDSTIQYLFDTFYHYYKALPYTPQIKATEVMADTARWYRISGIYTAEGGEQ